MQQACLNHVSSLKLNLIMKKQSIAQAPNICSRCQKRLGPQVIRTGGKQYHPHCFVCDHCKKSLEKTFYPRGERLYHPACHDKLFIPRCDHCGQSINGKYTHDSEGRYHPECYTQRHGLICAICSETIQGKYLYDHWGNKTHVEHADGPVRQCHVCARLMSATAAQGGRVLLDGRALCSACHSTEVSTFQEIQAAKLDVIGQMHQAGFDYIPDYIKVELSQDQQLLNQRMQASPTGNIHGFTRTAQRNIPGYGLILEHSISVLSGLPRVAFMSVLSHELLHVWIHENKLSHLSHAEVEGFCNLGAALILKEALNSKDAPLAEVLLRRMSEDKDLAYGEGYRAMAWRLENSTWPDLIAALKNSAQPLIPAPAEVLKAKEYTTAPPPPKPPPVPKAPTASESAAERLQKLKAEFQAKAQQNSGGSIPTHTKPSATSPNRPSTEASASSEAADKVRARFAQKPVSKMKKGTGSKLGKLGKKKKK